MKIPPGTVKRKVAPIDTQDDMALYDQMAKEKEEGEGKMKLRQAVPMDSKKFWKKAQKEREKLEQEKAHEAAERAREEEEERLAAGGDGDAGEAAAADALSGAEAVAKDIEGGDEPKRSFSFLPTSLPAGWKKTVNGAGQTMYYNEKTKETSYAPPLS